MDTDQCEADSRSAANVGNPHPHHGCFLPDAARVVDG